MDKEATNKYGDKGKDGVLEIALYGNKTGSTGKKQAMELLPILQNTLHF